MKQVTLKLTVEELKLLATLASDQLFRREFIDPRMPGYKGNPKEMELGKQLVGRLRLMIGKERQGEMAPEAGAGGGRFSNPSRRQGRIPDGV